MKIAVISDTHDSKDAIISLIDKINGDGVDIIIHAGDHISPFTVDWMSGFKARVFGVSGNNDCEREILRRKYDKRNWIFSYTTLAINISGPVVVTHGTEQRIVDAFVSSGEYQVVITGHLHKPIIEYHDETLYLNPGEACGYLTGKRTYALLKMPEKTVEIIEF